MALFSFAALGGFAGTALIAVLAAPGEFSDPAVVFERARGPAVVGMLVGSIAGVPFTLAGIALCSRRVYPDTWFEWARAGFLGGAVAGVAISFWLLF